MSGSSLVNTRIKLKKDSASNWQQGDPILLNGELIIVVTAAGETRFKVGDGTSKFSQLPFVDETTQQTLSTILSTLDSIDVSGKVDKAQGVNSAGDVLYVDSAGMVSSVDFVVSSDVEPKDALIWVDPTAPDIIPEITSEDEGKVLKITDGAISYSSLDPATFVVTITRDASDNYIADKTFAEIKAKYDLNYNIEARYLQRVFNLYTCSDGCIFFGALDQYTGYEMQFNSNGSIHISTCDLSPTPTFSVRFYQSGENYTCDGISLDTIYTLLRFSDHPITFYLGDDILVPCSVSGDESNPKITLRGTNREKGVIVEWTSGGITVTEVQSWLPPVSVTTLPDSGTALTSNTIYAVAAAVGTYAFTPPTTGWAHGTFTTDTSVSVSFSGSFLGIAPTIEASKIYEFDVFDGVWAVQEVVSV